VGGGTPRIWRLDERRTTPSSSARQLGMWIEVECWGGIVVRWRADDLWMLVDGVSGEVWFVWR
jgi:hypothetical protein